MKVDRQLVAQIGQMPRQIREQILRELRAELAQRDAVITPPPAQAPKPTQVH